MRTPILTIIALCAAHQATAQDLTVAIDTIAEQEESFLSTCQFSGTVTNAGSDNAVGTINVAHRLRPSTMSALTVPETDSVGQIFLHGLAPGAAQDFDVSMLGVDCADLDAVNFAFVCEGGSAGACRATLTAATGGVLPMQIADGDVLGDDLIAKGPLHGVYDVASTDGLNLMTLDVSDIAGSNVEMTFTKGPDYCTFAAAFCDETPQTITNDRIFLTDDGAVLARISVAQTTHTIEWDPQTGVGTFSDKRPTWDNTAVTVMLRD